MVLQVPSYIQICGIILGMITIGYLGDRIGRKWGSVTTVSIMGVRSLPKHSATRNSNAWTLMCVRIIEAA